MARPSRAAGATPSARSSSSGRVLAVLAITAVFANRQVLNADNWADTSSALLEDEAIQAQLGDVPRRRGLRERRRQRASSRPRCRRASRRSPARPPAPCARSPSARRTGSSTARACSRRGRRPTASPREQFIAIAEDESEGDHAVRRRRHPRPARDPARPRGAPRPARRRWPTRSPRGPAPLKIMSADQVETAEAGVTLLRSLAIVLPILAFGLPRRSPCSSPTGAGARRCSTPASASSSRGSSCSSCAPSSATQITSALASTESVEPAADQTWEIGTRHAARRRRRRRSSARSRSSLAALLAGPSRPATSLRRRDGPVPARPARRLVRRRRRAVRARHLVGPDPGHAAGHPRAHHARPARPRRRGAPAPDRARSSRTRRRRTRTRRSALASAARRPGVAGVPPSSSGSPCCTTRRAHRRGVRGREGGERRAAERSRGTSDASRPSAPPVRLGAGVRRASGLLRAARRPGSSRRRPSSSRLARPRRRARRAVVGVRGRRLHRDPQRAPAAAARRAAPAASCSWRGSSSSSSPTPLVLQLAADLVPDEIRVDGFGDALLFALVVVRRQPGPPDDPRHERRRRVRVRVTRRIARARARSSAPNVPGIIFLEIDGLALPVLRDAMRDGSAPGDGALDRGGRLPARGVGDRPVVADRREPGGDPARLERGHPRVPVGREGARAHDGLLVAGRLRRDRAPPRGQRAAAQRRREPRQPALRRGRRDDPHRQPHRRRAAARTPATARSWPTASTSRARSSCSSGRSCSSSPPRRARGAATCGRAAIAAALYPVMRAAMCVIVRDLIVFGVLGDMMRGRPAVYATFSSYDEVAHHSGLERADTLEALRKLDQQFARIERARRYAPRPYEIVVLSDHGQTQGATFKQRNGYGLDELVERSLGGARRRGLGRRRRAARDGAARGRARRRARDEKKPDEVRRLGPPGRRARLRATSGSSTSWRSSAGSRSRRSRSATRCSIGALREHPHVGWLLVRSSEHGAVVLGPRGHELPRGGPRRGRGPARAVLADRGASTCCAPTASSTSPT